MTTAKDFKCRGSQVVHLPKEIRFDTGEIVVQQLGDALLLVPRDSVWNTFVDGLNGFTEDIFADDRDQGIQKERDSL